MQTVLLGHAGSDVETTYRDLKRIEESEAHDPALGAHRTGRRRAQYGPDSRPTCPCVPAWRGSRKMPCCDQDSQQRTVMASILPPKSENKEPVAVALQEVPTEKGRRSGGGRVRSWQNPSIWQGC